MQAKIEESTFELPTPPNETDSGIMLSQRLFLDAADFTSTFLLQMAKCIRIAADGSYAYVELEDQAYCTQKTWQLRDAPGHSDCSAGPKDNAFAAKNSNVNKVMICGINGILNQKGTEICL